MTAICSGNKCEYADYCMLCWDTTSLEDAKAGKRTYQRRELASNYPDCQITAKANHKRFTEGNLSSAPFGYEL